MTTFPGRTSAPLPFHQAFSTRLGPNGTESRGIGGVHGAGEATGAGAGWQVHGERDIYI